MSEYSIFELHRDSVILLSSVGSGVYEDVQFLVRKMLRREGVANIPITDGFGKGLISLKGGKSSQK